MADDRSIPKGTAVQAHAASPPSPSSGSQQRGCSPSRGPRTLLLRRSENGFGFTLRHFIVYPPESCCMLPGHERTRIDEPMDTIFVKQVRSNSPAAEAGLRTGDRVVSVDGAPTRGERYASVVQRIQQAGPWLRLLVVSKEDDILQRYFGETAHNPETNQRPRLLSPERLLQKQRRSASMIPGPSSRTRQSWVCSSSGSEKQGTVTPPSYGSQEDASNKDVEMLASPSPRRSLEARSQESAFYGQHPVRPRRRQKDATSNQTFVQTSGPMSDTRFDLYEGTRPESIYSRPNNERIYDRIKDPIYERVVPDSLAKPVVDRFPMSRAEPQVPIYRPGGRRIVGRRASEGSGMITSETEIPVYGSVDALKPIDARVDPNSRLSVDSRRDSSPASKEESLLSSYDSTSTLTGNECSDDSAIMTRLRKSFEQKEEFLRRPSHPIGWLTFDEPFGVVRGRNVIQREFYARPQKLQRQVWPPNELQRQQQRQSLPSSSSSSSSSSSPSQLPPSSPTREQSIDRAANKPVKPTNQNVQRVKTDDASETERSNARANEHDQTRPSLEDVRAAKDRRPFYSYLCDDNGHSLEEERHPTYGESASDAHSNNNDVQFKPIAVSSRGINGGKTAFVATLSRIHENVITAQQQGQDSRNGTSSLPSSPGPEKRAGEKFVVPPQGLQIVSRRAKQFESGRLVGDNDDDEQPNDRTSLYKSELSRLSSKRSVPNVAVRKREFESKAEFQEPRRIPAHRESKSLDAGRGLSGNRVIPVGSKYVHCEPPADYREVKETPEMEMESVHLRARSNSAESWEAMNGSSRRSVRHTWQIDQEDPEESKRSKAKRQDSYLQAVRTQLVIVGSSESTRPKQVSVSNPARPSRNRESSRRRLGPAPPDVETLDGTAEILAPGSDSSVNGVVLRRQKSTPVNDEDRTTRRVSYLKATWGERMHVDSDLELSDSEPPMHVLRSAHRRWRPPLFPSDITPLRRIFEDVTQAASLHWHSHRNSIVGGHVPSGGAGLVAKDVEPVEQEGSLHVKFAMLDGRRSTDRSWKQVWAVLRGPFLYFYKDRHSQSPSTTSDGDTGQNVDVRCSLVDVAEDYTKRKHVLRVANPVTEVLLQTEDAASMALWLRALRRHAAAERPTDAGSTTTSKQQAVPQTPGPTTPSSAIQSGVAGSNQRLSPLPSHKGIRKLTSFRNRSPTGQSPVNKTRKPSQSVEPLPSPKTKTWKGRVAKQLRRMHGQAGSPSSPTTQLASEGATFKVPLELCPPSSFSEYVPLIVEMCTSIVEAKGLEVVGIYRVPGNTAAISQLTESVNRGFENVSLQDPRWGDVNVISSLLKSFFRQLPDSLLTAELYPMFIDADKIEDPQRRMATIRKLLRDLPEHHFETLKYLMFHLKKIVAHSEVNKMEAKNLAIVFGPTLVRASGSRDNMVTMVTDMSHQCRIVESLLNNVDWFFSEDDLDDLSRLSVNLSLPADGSEVEPTSHTNHNLLLNNIQKVEGMREMMSARDIVSSIISAANRKIQRRRKGQDEVDNEDHDDDKPKGKQEAENLVAVRQSMALNERQCSVSEIVSMHENKSQSNRSTDRSNTAVLGAENNCDDGDDSCSSSIISSANPRSIMHLSTNRPITSETSGLSIDLDPTSLDTISTISSTSNDTRHSNDEVAIRTYAGLSATTRERIRRFEQETKAMLQRDQHRQRREAEKREEERKRIEVEWQLAKREMESDDILDSIVDTTVTPTFLSKRLANLNERLTDRHANRSRSTTRMPSISMAEQQQQQQQPQPTAQQRAQASSQLSSLLGEKMSNGIIKKFKTDKEASSASICSTPTRYGSLDSLHEVHPLPHLSGLSSTQQQRGISGDVSDDGSDLLTSLTSTFDRKWKSLVYPIDQPTPSTEPVASEQECDFNDLSQIRRGTSADVYRDPSLHKSSVDKNCLFRTRNVAPESDTDSTVNGQAATEVTTVPDNDREVTAKSSMDNNQFLDATEKDENLRVDNITTTDLLYTVKVKHFESLNKAVEEEEEEEEEAAETEYPGSRSPVNCQEESKSKEESAALADSPSYSNKLEKFENLNQSSSESRSRLKRSESLNKKTESTTSKLKRSESLNKHSDRAVVSPTNGSSKLKRSESLNKHSDNSESPNGRLKRSESLTKTEKTESNISKRRQSVRKESATKLKRKNGMPERSIKRRHTVGGTKDFDKINWLDNKLQTEAEKVIRNGNRHKKNQLRTSSPDLSSNRVNVTDTSFLIEVSFRGPSNVVFNVTNARPQSLPDANLASKVFKVPLESHV